MAVVGSAEIVVRAITDQVKKDIKKAFKDLRPAIAAEGKRAGQIYSDEFNDSIKGRLGSGLSDTLRDSTREATDGMREALDDATDDIADDVEADLEDAGRRGGNSFYRGFLRSRFADSAVAASKAFTTVFAIGNLAGAGVSGLVGSLSALVTSLFSVAASASQAAGALGVLPGIYTSVAQAAGVTQIAMIGVSDAIKAGGDAAAAAAEGGEEAKKAMEKYEAALAKLSPAARSFVEYLLEVKGQFTVIKEAAQQGLFPGVQRALENIVGGNTIQKLADGFGRTAELVGEAAEGISQMFALGSKNNLTKFLEANNRIIEIFVDRGGAGENVLTKLVRLFIRLRLAVQPVTERFALWIASLIRGAAWATNSGKEINKLTEFFNKAGDRAALLGDITKNLIDIFIGLGKAASPAGTGLLKSFRSYTRALEKTVNVKQENLREYFHEVADTLRSIADLTRAIGRGLADLGDNEGLQGFIDGLIPAVESFTNIGNAMASAGPQLSEFISQVAEILEAFADTEALQLFFDILNEVLGLIIDFIKTDFGGYLLATIGTIAAITRSISLMRSAAVLAFKILIGGSIGAARSLDALSLSAGRAATALTASQAYATATTRMGRLSAAAGIAARKIGALAGPATRVAGPMAGFAIATSDTAQSIEGINVATGAAIGLMFGPWGAALGAAAGLAYEVVTANKDLEDSIKAVNEGIAAGVAPNTLNIDLANAEKELADLKHNVEEAWDEEGMNLEAGFQWSKNALTELFTGTSTIEKSEKAVEEAEEALNEYTDAVRRARREARAFDAGYVDIVRRSGLVAVASAEGFRELTRAISVQQRKSLEALDADYALAAALRDVNRRVKENKKGFNENTEAGYTNYQTLLSVAAALNRTNKPYKDKVKQLREVARSMGASKEETEEFVEALIKVPKGKQFRWSVRFDRDKLQDALAMVRDLPRDIEQHIRTKGIPETVREVDRLVKKYDLTEEERETLIKIKDNASGTIRDIRERLRDLDGTTAEVGINVLINMPNIVPGQILGDLLDGDGTGSRPDQFGRNPRNRRSGRETSGGQDRLPNEPFVPLQRSGPAVTPTVINIERLSPHDYSEFVRQMERRRRRRGLGGYN